MPETKTSQNLVEALAQRRASWQATDYVTAQPNEKTVANRALTFTQTELAVPEIAKYHGKIGEVWAAVNSLLEQEIQLRESTTGDEKEAHASIVEQLVSMLGVLEHDLELSPIHHVDSNVDDLDSGISDMARAGLGQAREDRLMTQHTLLETKTLLERLLEVKRAEDTTDIANNPEFLKNHQNSIQATELLIAYVDRLLGIS